MSFTIVNCHLPWNASNFRISRQLKNASWNARGHLQNRDVRTDMVILGFPAVQYLESESTGQSAVWQENFTVCFESKTVKIADILSFHSRVSHGDSRSRGNPQREYKCGSLDNPGIHLSAWLHFGRLPFQYSFTYIILHRLQVTGVHNSNNVIIIIPFPTVFALTFCT